MNCRRIGAHAESLACRYLERHGLSLLQRNFRCARGEIDLVMQDGDSLVFVEVRYRKHTHYGRAAETVSQTKQSRIIHCARYYMKLNHSWNATVRFDVVAIDGGAHDLNIKWHIDAFRVSC
jgi:putative endonuclease